MEINEYCAMVYGGGASKENILRCMLGLGDTDISVWASLERQGTTRDLVRITGKDQSTVSRSLAKLASKGLVLRQKKTGSRGFHYIFRRMKMEDTKRRLEKEAELKSRDIIRAIRML